MEVLPHIERQNRGLLEGCYTHLVIIQPSPFCNIDCNYCYLPDRLSTKRMSTSTLENVYDFLFARSDIIEDKITIVWHAGEPLALPISFYERAFQLLKEHNIHDVRVDNAFQTNGTLLTQEWCDFIKKHNVSIGVSLDGPKHIHDSCRTDRAGRGTFDRVVRGIELLKQNGIEFHTISVLTGYALDYPDDIWKFFNENQITNLAFNIEEVEGIHIQSSLQTHQAILKYKQFLQRLLELRDEKNERIFVRELDYHLDLILNGRANVRGAENTPLSILSIGWDGAVSTFSPELLSMEDPRYGHFRFGNVNHNQIEDILQNPNFIQVHSDIRKGVEKCKGSCQYFSVCGGGSPSNKLYENGSFDSTETMSCNLRVKVLTDVCVEYLEKYYQLL